MTAVNAGATDSTAGTYNYPANLVAAGCVVSTSTPVMSLIDMWDYDYSNVQTTIASTSTTLIDDPDRVTPVVTCVAYDSTKDAIKIINTSATPTYMCDYYNKVDQAEATMTFLDSPSMIATGGGAMATPTYECMRCPIGKQGTLAQGAAGTYNRQDRGKNIGGYTATTAELVQYISSCDAFAGCDSTRTVIYGLQQHWVKMFSCYFCSQGGIPVMIFKGHHINRPTFFNWTQTNLASGASALWTAAPSANVSNITCMDVSTAASIRTNLSISATITTVAKMPGCGLAVLNTQYGNTSGATDKFNNTIWGTDGTVALSGNGALLCAACSPNYKPTYYTSTILWDGATAGDDINIQKNWFVTSCTAIPNCTSNSNVMMNGCQKCDSGFGFLAKTFGTGAGLNLTTANGAKQFID